MYKFGTTIEDKVGTMISLIPSRSHAFIAFKMPSKQVCAYEL